MDQYRNIGKLVAVFGLQGELVLQHRLGKKTALKGLRAIFLEQSRDEMLPWPEVDAWRLRLHAEFDMALTFPWRHLFPSRNSHPPGTLQARQGNQAGRDIPTCMTK